MLVLVALAAPAAAQETRFNAPTNCPYCGGDPERMEPAGIVSHGGFEFTARDTHGIDELLPNAQIFWIESKHFETGLAIGSHKVGQSEKKKIRAELTRLKEVLPSVKPKTKVLDPWLRTHLYAQRVEDVYRDFLAIMRVTDDQFPDGTSTWISGTPYWGEGPHVGQKGKYETLVLPNAEQQVVFLHEQFGLQIRNTQKWNVTARDSLIMVTNLAEEGIRGDEHLHNIVAFNAIHNLVDGYKHYSYETPLWLKEGLAHYIERNISPHFNSFSYTEGGLAETFGKDDWDAEVAKRLQKNALPRLAELVALRSFSEFEVADHLACWSMVAFLVEEHPAAFAAINARLHGVKGTDHMPDGSNMSDKHRTAFTEALGMSYLAFDTAWHEWASAR